MNKTFQCILLLALALPWPSLAQTRGDIPARIALKEQSGIADVLLTGRRGNTLYARLNAEATGSITYDARDVKRIAVSLPGDDLRQAEIAAASGQTQEVVRLLRAAVRPVLPFLDLPIDGAIEPALLYAKFLRAEKLWAEAASVYKAMHGNADAAISQQAVGWLAYCFARNLQTKEAREWIDLFVEEHPGNPGFVPAMLAESMLMAGEGRDEEALDLAARASALARIDNELYPESIYLSADAYYRMSRKKVEAGRTSDIVLSKGDKEQPPPPPMSPEEYLAVATNQFNRVLTYFPSSTFAALAGAQLKAIEQEIETTQKSDQPESGDKP